MYPESHKSSNWENHMPVVVNDVIKREHGLNAKLDRDLINKVANTHLGIHMSNYNGKTISRDTIREITKHLLDRARKIDAENHLYQLKSSHYWASKSYDYITRRIEENINEVHPEMYSHTDTLVIGDCQAVMLVPRVSTVKNLKQG